MEATILENEAISKSDSDIEKFSSPIPQVNFEPNSNNTDTTRKYVVKDPEGRSIGDLDLMYYPRRKEVEIGWVGLLNVEGTGEPLTGKGYGLAIYTGIPNLPSPDGSKYTFVSSGQPSENSTRVWESLVRRGLAVQEETGRYRMLEKNTEHEIA